MLLSREVGGRSAPIRFFDFESRKVQTLEIRQEELLVVRLDQRESDLMLIDTFR